MPISRTLLDDVYTVSRLNREVRMLLETHYPTLWVEGEVSNLAQPASGHLYFTLKDNDSQIRCAIFKNHQSGLNFELENGLQVLAQANISLYETRGDYQLIINSLALAGSGALQLAFEKLKQKLDAAGLFAATHKKTLPRFPHSIGVITSDSGAALQDILSVLQRRYRCAQVIIYPVSVQGVEAAKQIAAMIELADQRAECAVLILARGGGSLEDLWAFNEEIVAQAIYECTLPLVTGIGHEIDFCIADFVADQRAATPSAAAELVSPDQDELLLQLQGIFDQLVRFYEHYITQLQNQVSSLSKQLIHPQAQLQQLTQRADECSLRLAHEIEMVLNQNRMKIAAMIASMSEQSPLLLVQQQMQLLSQLHTRLCQAIVVAIEELRQRLVVLKQTLVAVSPNATLARGYAIVTDGKAKNVTDTIDQLNIGDTVHIHLSEAELDTTVHKVRKKR